MPAKQCDGLADQISRGEVGNEADKVGGVRIKEAKRNGVLLAPFFVRIVANGFDRQHGDDFFTPLAGAARVDTASHLLGLKERRFFVDEGDKAKRAFKCEDGVRS